MRDTFVRLLELILLAWLLIMTIAVMVMSVPIPDAPVKPPADEPTPIVTWFPATITPSLTATPTPTPVGNIPAPNFSYPCIESNGAQCVHPDDAPADLIVHTLFNEGGSLSHQIAVDVLQVIYNIAYSSWMCQDDCSSAERAALNPAHIPWADVDSDTFTRLVLFVLSTPYTAPGGTQYAAFNGWQLPLPASAHSNPTEIRMYQDQRAAVEMFLTIGSRWGNPQNADIQITESGTGHVFRPQVILRDASIQCFFSTMNELPTFFPVIATDRFDYQDGRVLFVSYGRTLSTHP